MTLVQLMTHCRNAGILFHVDADGIDVDAPRGVLTPDLRATLGTRKAELLAVLRRLDGMRKNVGEVPIPCAVLEALGGPGYCFSCGDDLEHQAAYGRCLACDVAKELLYREIPDAAERWESPTRERG